MTMDSAPSPLQDPLDFDDLLDKAALACDAGEELLESRRYSEAAEAFRNALQLAERCQHNRWYATASFGLGRALVGMQDYEEAIPILERARSRFTSNRPTPIPRRVADCEHALGCAHHELGQLDEAVSAFESALATYFDSNLRRSPEYHSCTLNYAKAIAARGTVGRALQILKEAERRAMSRQEAVEVAIDIGVLHGDSGRYSAAHEQLEHARATASDSGFDDLVALCDMNLGYVHLQSGRSDLAERAYERAKDFFEHRDRIRYASCWMSLGAAYGAQGDHPGAISAYSESLAIFKTLKQPRQIAICRMNLGSEYAAEGNLCQARKLYQEALDFFGNAPDMQKQAAGCTMNLARLDGMLGDRPEAQQRYSEAASAFRNLGLYAWEARCTTLRAASRMDDCRDAKSDDYGSITTELLSALLHLDSVKFQFPTAAARLAWRSTVTDATRIAFELASESRDSDLVAQLIENTINSGVHSHPDGEPDARIDGPDRGTEEVLLQAPRSMWTSEDHRSSGASVQLVAGAILPMSAPPLLRMPNGVVALEIFHRAAAHYGHPDDSVPDARAHQHGIVDTWWPVPAI